MICSTFYFSALQIVLLHSLESISFLQNTLIFFLYFVLFLKAEKAQLARGKACIFSQLCPIFTVIFSTFYFSALQISLTLLGITFVKNIFLFLGRVPR